MFANTITIGFASGSVTLNRINQDQYSSEYMKRTATKQYTLKIRHNRSKATASRPAYDRHNVELIVKTFQDGDTPEYDTKAYFVMENLPSDDTIEVMDALADWAIATSGSNLTALLGWES